MESLKFILICDRLVEFVADFKSQQEDSHNNFTLAVVKEEIRDIWADIKNAYSKFMESTLLVEVKVPKTEVEAVKSKYRSCFKLYTTCISAIGQIGVQFEEVTVQKTEASGSRGFHVPPCDMEVFSGDYLKWPSFRDLFTAVYVKNSSLSKVEKLFHLNSKTSGDAKEIVSKAPLTNEGFDVAWSNLVQRFENKRILVNSQLRILFNMPPISTESGEAIKGLQNTINNSISALKLHKVDVTNWDCILFYLCSTRLPMFTLSLWEYPGLDRNSSMI